MHACNNVRLPAGRLPFLIGGQAVGWISVTVAAELAQRPGLGCENDKVALNDPLALPCLAQDLSARGLFRLRGEAFDVRATPDGAVLTQIDRGAIPAFGIQASGVHINGLVRRDDELHMWIARRATNKQLDPGKLDHIVAGGVPAGLSPAETLVKEAAEEASIPEELARSAVAVGIIGYVMQRPEGLAARLAVLLRPYASGRISSPKPRTVKSKTSNFGRWRG